MLVITFMKSMAIVGVRSNFKRYHEVAYRHIINKVKTL